METNLRLEKKKNTKKFKSYYVVWKPLTLQHSENSDYSLNRTMQYGNKRGYEFECADIPV